MKLFSFIVLSAYFPVIAFAHGVEYSTFEGGIGFILKYNTGQLVTGAHVKVYSPDGMDELYQWGVTDLNGRFVFSPVQSGEWLIEINDGTGHGIKEKITISDDLALGKDAGPESQTVIWKDIITGVSIIFGFSGIWYYRMAKRSKNSVS